VDYDNYFTKQTFGKNNHSAYLREFRHQTMPVKKIDKRTIIKESLMVFRQKGYHNTTMSDIAIACGLLKGSLYHYFSSKEELMKEVIVFLHEWYKREVFSVAYDESLSGHEKLDRLAEMSEYIFYNEPGGCLMANIGLETANTYPEFAELIKGFFEDWIAALAHIFRDGHGPIVARQLAELSVAEIEGAVMLMQVYQDRDYLKRAHDHIRHRYAIHSIASPQKA
jgi:TetR/AcrR family transcriptional repressor of nem operon